MNAAPLAIAHHIKRPLDDEEELALVPVEMRRRAMDAGRRDDFDHAVGVVGGQRSNFVTENPKLIVQRSCGVPPEKTTSAQ